MKLKIFIFSIICCMFLVACRYSSSSGTRHGIASQEMADPDEEDELKMDNEFYEALLEAFCQKHYEKKLKGTYISKSIHDITVTREDANIVKVEGKHSFKGVKVLGLESLQAKYENRLFWATVRREDRNTFVVNFSRELANPGEDVPVVNTIDLPNITSGDIPFQFVYHK